MYFLLTEAGGNASRTNALKTFLSSAYWGWEDAVSVANMDIAQRIGAASPLFASDHEYVSGDRARASAVGEPVHHKSRKPCWAIFNR